MKNDLVLNALLTRQSFLDKMMDGKRDIDQEAGYPKEISIEQYQMHYEREGIAARVVSIYPEDTWAQDPEILESEKPTNSSFENLWHALAKKHRLLSYLERLDELSGIGRFGILLIGIDDGLPLEKPVADFDNPSKKDPKNNIIYLRPFSEASVLITKFDKDPLSPRFGMPELYSIKFTDYASGQNEYVEISRTVHWHRILHASDGNKTSEVFGTPRMKPVFNRLYDLRKILGGSGEMFWRGAFPGYSFEVHPDLVGQGVNLDKEGMREEFERYSMGLSRYMALQGVTAKSLSPQVADPNPHFMANLRAICISIGVPWRIFLGSEEAKLASVMDTRAWETKIARRRERHNTPMILYPFVRRLMSLGVLPRLEDVFIVWPDVEVKTDSERADVAAKRMEAISKYVGGQVDTLIPPLEFFTIVLDMSVSEANAIIEAANKALGSDMDEDGAEEENDNDSTTEED